jgi:hypothetical protein
VSNYSVSEVWKYEVAWGMLSRFSVSSRGRNLNARGLKGVGGLLNLEWKERVRGFVGNLGKREGLNIAQSSVSVNIWNSLVENEGACGKRSWL